MSMMKIEVGKPYDDGIIPLFDSTIFDFSNSGAVLLMIMKHPTPAEIKAVKDGDIKLGLVEVDGVLFILAKFGTQPWVDASYHASLSKPGIRFGTVENGAGYSLSAILIDTDGRIVKVIRYVAMPTEMSRKFREIALEQLKTPRTILDQDARVSEIYQKYPTQRFVAIANAKGQIYTLPTKQ